MMWLVALCSISVAVAFWLAVKVGEVKSHIRHEARRNEELADEAQDYADIPLTDVDTINRLRERIKQKNKAKNKR